MNVIYVIHALKISRIIVSVTYCDLRIDNLKSCNVWTSCNVTGVVCHSDFCGSVLCGLSDSVMSHFCGGCTYLNVVIYSGLYANCDDSKL